LLYTLEIGKLVNPLYCSIALVQNLNIYVLSTIIVFILFLLNLIFISIFESAFFMLPTEDIKSLKFDKEPDHKRLSEFIEKPDQLLITLRISCILFSFGIILLNSLLIDCLIDLSDFNLNSIFFIKLLFVSFIIIFIGMQLPKAIAAKKPRKYLNLSLKPFYLIFIILRPISSGLIRIDSYFRNREIDKKAEISMDNLSSSLDITNHEIKDNKKILEGIVSYGSTDASEIMKPRVDIVAFNISTSFIDLLEKIKKQNYSRIPVYAETLDNIKGVLFVKDLLPHFHKPNFNWQTLIRPAYFVPRSKKINDLLLDFQTKKIHMSIVIDEYGGTCGIVTLEDVLEEIVGEIVDEFDTEDEFYKKIDEFTSIFEGKTLINDFYKVMNLDDDFFDEIRGDAETMAGLILELNGEIPKLASIFKFENYIFKIIAVDKRRIKQIHVTLLSQ